ncbi:LamG domain-containing protein [Glycomyces sp. NPDC047010]|uniref:LamG domain-containing protein n=1 Tax=Glycomyces sp. NPDC047010 TaxID=3155023 RepID=UPI003404642A
MPRLRSLLYRLSGAAAALAVAAGAVALAAAPAQAAPAAPVIELLTPSPLAGSPVEIRISSPDTDIAAFQYGIGTAAPQERVESTGEAVVSFTAAAGRTVVYAWAENTAGELSPQAELSFFAGRFIAPAAGAVWRLDGDGADDAGRAGPLGLPADAAWEPTEAPAPYGRALGFDGGDCAASGNGAAIRTDAAFWMSAWVRLDAKDADQVIASKAGTARTGFALAYDADSDRFTATTVSLDSAAGQEHTVSSTAAPATGEWTHLTVVVSGGTIALYVDGALDAQDTVNVRAVNFTGPIHLGCDASTGSAGLTGALTHVAFWQGGPDQAYRDAAYRGDLAPGAAAAWPLRGGGTAVHGPDLDVPSSIEWVADQYNRIGSAASLDGNTCLTAADGLVSSPGDLSVEAWVRLDRTDRDQTVASQAAQHGSSLSLGFDADAQTWELALPSADGANPQWAVATGTSTPAAGEWTHLAATVDVDREGPGMLSLYVNGVLEGSAELAFTPVSGADAAALGCAVSGDGSAVRHLDGALSDATVWRGVLGQAAVTASYSGNPAAVVEAAWDFTFGDIDNWTEHELDIVGAEGTDWYWEDTEGTSYLTGLTLDGTGNGYGTTAGPVLATDESFTVMASVNLAGKGADQTFLAQAGDGAAGFELGYDAALDRLHFTMHSADGTEAQLAAPTAPQTGTWYTVAAVFDLKTGQTRLYLDGHQVATGDGPTSPWNTDGPVTLGLAADTAGTHTNPLDGSVSRPFLWSSIVDDETLELVGV